MNSFSDLSICYSWVIDAILVIILLSVPTSIVVIFTLRVIVVHFPLAAFMYIAGYYDEHVVRANVIAGAILYAISVITVICIWYK